MSLPNRSTASTFNALGKVNSQNIPPAYSTGNGNTDWDNPSLAQAVSDVAALGLTAPRFWARVTLAATTGALVLNSWQAVWENATPTTPILARAGTGQFTITVPSVVSDEYDASVGVNNNITVNLSAASGSFEFNGGSHPFGFVNANASGNVITIQTGDYTGAASDMVNFVVFVRAF